MDPVWYASELKLLEENGDRRAGTLRRPQEDIFATDFHIKFGSAYSETDVSFARFWFLVT